jgi:hypothetical protein
LADHDEGTCLLSIEPFAHFFAGSMSQFLFQTLLRFGLRVPAEIIGNVAHCGIQHGNRRQSRATSPVEDRPEINGFKQGAGAFFTRPEPTFSTA